MNSAAVELNEGHFRDIGDFIRTHFHEWLLEDRRVNGDAVDIKLGRIENSLEAEIVLSRDRFEATERRFESMDKRFDEQMAFTRERFAHTDRRIEEEHRLTREEFSRVDYRLELTEKRMNRHFAVLFTFVSAVFAAVSGVLVQGFFF